MSEEVQVVRDFSSQNNIGYLGFNNNKETSDPVCTTEWPVLSLHLLLINCWFLQAVITGKRGKALLFDGIDDRVTVPHSRKLLLSGQSFSFSLSFLWNGYVDNSDHQMLLSKHWTHDYREWDVSLSTKQGDQTRVRIY